MIGEVNWTTIVMIAAIPITTGLRQTVTRETAYAVANEDAPRIYQVWVWAAKVALAGSRARSGRTTNPSPFATRPTAETSCARRVPGSANEKRDALRRFVNQVRMPALTVDVQPLAMVAGHHEERFVPRGIGLQGVEESAELGIGVGDLAVVRILLEL